MSWEPHPWWLRRYGGTAVALVVGTRGSWLGAHLLASPVRPAWAAAPPQRLTDGASLLAVRCQARRALPYTHVVGYLGLMMPPSV